LTIHRLCELLHFSVIQPSPCQCHKPNHIFHLGKDLITGPSDLSNKQATKGKKPKDMCLCSPPPNYDNKNKNHTSLVFGWFRSWHDFYHPIRQVFSTHRGHQFTSATPEPSRLPFPFAYIQPMSAMRTFHVNFKRRGNQI
jgi:hypothetical protein